MGYYGEILCLCLHNGFSYELLKRNSNKNKKVTISIVFKGLSITANEIIFIYVIWLLKPHSALEIQKKWESHTNVTISCMCCQLFYFKSN